MSLIQLLYDLYTRIEVELQERHRWSGKSNKNYGLRPRVFYGVKHLPNREDASGGGIIKTQDLITRYPQCMVDPNLLYLVSSALPPYAARIAELARRFNGRVVLNQNGVAYPGWYGRGFEKVNKFFRDVISQANLVIYQSKFCQRAADRFVGQSKGLATILYNPVDTNFFTPALQKGFQNEVRLLVAGTHQQSYRVQKGVETLRYLMKRKKVAAQLIVSGRLAWNPEFKSCQQDIFKWAKNAGVEDKIFISGPYSQIQAPDIFRSADILLHTTYNDACPRTVVEALACGIPIVYSASGGVPELVDENSGIGVPAPEDWEHIHPPEASDLGDAVINVLDDYNDRAIAARRRAIDRFDTKFWLERHKEWFEMVLSN